MSADLFMLDTSTCLHVVARASAAVRARFARHAANQFSISVITWGELQLVLQDSPTPLATQYSLVELVRVLTIEPLTSDIALHYTAVHRHLWYQGLPLEGNEVWVAAHARALNRILVISDKTAPVVPGLVIENWAPLGPWLAA